nr:unnamed protein product [Callosobruchus chinensis]
MQSREGQFNSSVTRR